MVDTVQKAHHLYNRAAFGLPIEKHSTVTSTEQEVEKLFSVATTERSIDVIQENPFTKFREQFANGKGNAQMRQMIQKEVRASRNKIRDMNVQWMDQLIESDKVLREKLTLFWHDHFGVRNVVGYYAQQHNNMLRKYALGKYGDLLLAVAKDPAMLQFLNNQQNVRTKPNENFARELLELFTLGRGNYTEKDVKNAARAFTGWGFDRFSGGFRFRRFQHDGDHKEFMGKKGDLNGDDIMNIVLENPRTSKFLAAKFFQYYVSDQPDHEIIDQMAGRLFKSDYDIEDLLHFTFKADWFYEQRFMRNKIKSPVELINGLRVHFNLSFEQPMAVLYLERSLGQVLFYPPSVNGWPVGREWIDSSSLINRMRLSGVLLAGGNIDFRPKDDGDNNNPFKGGLPRLLRNVRADWKGLEALLAGAATREEELQKLTHFLLGRELDGKTKSALLAEYKKRKKGPEATQWLAVSIASLPQYQLS